MQCLVTGGSGYLGAALVPALVAGGHQVTAQYHAGAAPAHAASTVRCEFPDSIESLPLAGVDLVYHLAGIAHQQADKLSYLRVNVQTSVALAERAAGLGVRRFVYLSSVKAGSTEGEVSDYGESKAEAEQQLQAILRDSDTQLVIVRPALIYCADAPGHLAWLRRWTQLRLPGLPAGGARSMIAKQDLVELLCQLTTLERETPPLIVATDGERYSTQRLHRAFVAALQREPLFSGLPQPLWKLAAAALDALRGERAGSTWERIAGVECYAPEGLVELGFSPSRTFESCLAENPL